VKLLPVQTYSIGAPPSSSGAFQASLALFLVTSGTSSGPFGLPGGPDQ